MSKKEFNTAEKMGDYFQNPESEFHSQDSKFGVFLFPKGWLAEDGIAPKETVLFSYQGKVIYVAKTLSGRLMWDGPESDAYPYYLQID